MLVNLSGKAGAFSAGDIVQEFYNRLLEAIIERKGADFGDTFIRQVISRNLHHMGRVKTDLREGVGLAAKSGCHSDPHTRPEVKILLAQYAKHELHSRRPGRTIEKEDIDDFQKGWQKLAQGKLKRWVADTVRSRSLRTRNTAASPTDIEDDGSGSEDEDCDSALAEEPLSSTFGYMQMVDGQLIIETGDFEDAVGSCLSALEEEHSEDSEVAEDTEEHEEDSS